MLYTVHRDVSSGDGAGSLPLSIIGLKGVEAEDRPLVHVFLVQESMPLDALMAVCRHDCYQQTDLNYIRRHQLVP